MIDDITFLILILFFLTMTFALGTTKTNPDTKKTAIENTAK